MRLFRSPSTRPPDGRAAIVLLLGVALLLAACGGSEAPVDAPASSTPATTTPTATPSLEATEAASPPPVAGSPEATAEPSASPEARYAAPPPPPPGQRPSEEFALPEGFTAYRWASDFFQPTVIDFSPDGRLFIAKRFGEVWTAADLDADGFAEARVLFAESFDEPVTGLLVVDDRTIYVSDESRLYLLVDADGDGVADAREVVLDELPFGLHHSNGLTFGPDGRLYLTIGSVCNECVTPDPDPRSATIQALDLDSGELETVATGLRNPYDLVFTPDGQLWATDNGSDPPCATPDELNRIVTGADYGWPYCAAAPPDGSSEEPALTLGLHTSANGLVWLDHDPWPDQWRHGFYIALFGSFSAEQAEVGRRVQFAQLLPDGTFELRDFATGLERPLALTIGADGALYLADFGAGAIYRILATGP